MKPILFLILLSALLRPVLGHSQSYENEAFDPELEEQLMPEESLAEAHEIDALGEHGQQEDVLHPEGEMSDWSLGGEDLPAQEFE